MSSYIGEERLYTTKEISKPCHTLEYCPYGALVEYYPLYPEHNLDNLALNALARQGKLHTGYSCEVFGHDCPVFYQAEMTAEKSTKTKTKTTTGR